MPFLQKIGLLAAGAIILCALGIADRVAMVRTRPEVSANVAMADKNDFDSHVLNIWRLAENRVHDTSGNPNFEGSAMLPVYDLRHPGLFLLVAEMFVRSGATTPLPLQVLSVLLFNAGAMIFFAWVWLLFGDLLAATAATAMLIMTPFFLFFSGAIHTMPFEFFFFNLMMLLYVGWLKTDRRGFLIASLIALFLTCMNYWFYYLSSWIIMLGLYWQYRARPRLKDIALISAAPLIAAALTIVTVMIVTGGIRVGGMRLLEELAARTIDARVPGGNWYPDTKFMSAADWRNYPEFFLLRIRQSYAVHTSYCAIGATLTILSLWFRKRESAISALILILGAFLWYAIMFQHTRIHQFAGQYCFMAVCPLFGLIIAEAFHGLGNAVHQLSLKPLAIARIAASIVLALVAFRMTLSSVRSATITIGETLELAETISEDYDATVIIACDSHQEITVDLLSTKSKDWGIPWRPEYIAEENEMPACATDFRKHPK